MIDAAEIVHNKAEEELIVKGNIEKTGEYAVVIKAIDKMDKTQKAPKPVAGYLVTTQADEEDGKFKCSSGPNIVNKIYYE